MNTIAKIAGRFVLISMTALLGCGDEEGGENAPDTGAEAGLTLCEDCPVIGSATADLGEQVLFMDNDAGELYYGDNVMASFGGSVSLTEDNFLTGFWDY